MLLSASFFLLALLLLKVPLQHQHCLIRVLQETDREKLTLFRSWLVVCSCNSSLVRDSSWRHSVTILQEYSVDEVRMHSFCQRPSSVKNLIPPLYKKENHSAEVAIRDACLHIDLMAHLQGFVSHLISALAPWICPAWSRGEDCRGIWTDEGSMERSLYP